MTRRASSWIWPLLVTVLAACSGSPPAITGSPNATATAPGASPAETGPGLTPSPPTATNAATGQPAPTGTLVVGPGELLLDVPSVGLSSVGSYRSTLTVVFVGTQGGQSADWSVTTVMANGGADVGRYFTLATTGTGAPAEPTEAWERNGIAYTAEPGEGCSGRRVDHAELLQVTSEPAASLPAVVGAEAAGQEAVEGVAANHYTFDQRAIGLDGLADASGELWLAVDGGYLLRYVLAITGGGEYFGPDSEGSLSYEYGLSDVSQPLDIGLPADCPAGLIDAPVPNAATSVLIVPGLLQYVTTVSLSDALDYYRNQADALGWTLIQGPLTTDTAALIEYTTAQGPISILATASDAGTTLSITFGQPAQP